VDKLFALVAATALLVAIPGPNVALIVATSLKSGFRQGLLTVAGTTVGVGMQLALVVAGLVTLVEAAASALYWLKWLGAAYLVWLGIRAIGRAGIESAQAAVQPAAQSFRRGVLLAVVNPKTLLFNAAFLPQFVGSMNNAVTELAVLATVYLSVIAIGDAAWAAFAGSARSWIDRRVVLRERIAGSMLIAAGLGLASVARRDG